MDPIQTFHRVFHLIGRFQVYCGMGMMTPGFRPHAITAFWALLNTSYFVCSLYTIAFYDNETKFKCLTCLGITIQGLVKYGSMLKSYSSVNTKIVFLESIYASNQKSSSQNYRLLAKFAKLSHIIVIVGSIIICISIASFLPLTMIANFVTGKRDPILQAFLPFIDETTDGGYAILFGYHVLILILAVTGTAAVDLLLVLFIVHLWLMSEIIQNTINTLNRAVAKNAYRESDGLAMYFRNLILMHKEFCRYLEEIAEIYGAIIFAEVNTSGVSMCVMIFCLLTLEWFELYFLFMLMFVKLLVYCMLGTLAEITTDRVREAMVQSNWNQLPLKHQRSMILMMCRAQNPTILMAGTVPLNLDTFVTVMKSVYSVGMLLIESVG